MGRGPLKTLSLGILNLTFGCFRPAPSGHLGIPTHLLAQSLFGIPIGVSGVVECGLLRILGSGSYRDCLEGKTAYEAMIR